MCIAKPKLPEDYGTSSVYPLSFWWKVFVKNNCQKISSRADKQFITMEFWKHRFWKKNLENVHQTKKGIDLKISRLCLSINILVAKLIFFVVGQIMQNISSSESVNNNKSKKILSSTFVAQIAISINLAIVGKGSYITGKWKAL